MAIADLHQKLTKAQTSIPSTRPPQPVLIDEKAVIKVRTTLHTASLLMLIAHCSKRTARNGRRARSRKLSRTGERIRAPFEPRTDTRKPHYSDKIATEAQHGLIAQVLKDMIFSSRLGTGPASTSNVADTVDTAMSIG